MRLDNGKKIRNDKTWLQGKTVESSFSIVAKKSLQIFSKMKKAKKTEMKEDKSKLLHIFHLHFSFFTEGIIFFAIEARK